jgi:hypothetical protein
VKYVIAFVAAFFLVGCNQTVDPSTCTFLPTGERFHTDPHNAGSSYGNWWVGMRSDSGKTMIMTSATADKWQCDGGL